jgi:hypothetical protein
MNKTEKKQRSEVHSGEFYCPNAIALRSAEMKCKYFRRAHVNQIALQRG